MHSASLTTARERSPLTVVCHCLQITEEMVLDALAVGEIQSVQELRRCTGAGEGCTACISRLRAYVEEHVYACSSEPICSVK